MKETLFRNLIFCIFAFLVTAPVACQDGPDDWEKFHNSYQPPEKVMTAMGIKPGMIIGEVGAGRGRYAVQMARKVGETGKIYANDIDESALEYLMFRCKRDSINNVVAILGKVTDPLFSAAELDLVYIINTYHHLDKPVDLLKKILPGLKPAGMLVIVEHDPEKVKKLGWDEHSISTHATAKEKVIENAIQAGFELDRVETYDFMPRDNMYFLRPKH